MTLGNACPVSSAQANSDVTLSVAQQSNPESAKATSNRVVGKRNLGTQRQFTIEEVRKHNTKDDAWIVVHGKVYDITEHILNHPGWETAAISTVLSIIAHSGMDCTEEFVDIHRPYPIAWNQLKAYYIGELVESN